MASDRLARSRDAETTPIAADAAPGGTCVGSARLLPGNVTIGGHRTSVRLEGVMWDALREIASETGLTIHQVCSMIDDRRGGTGVRAGRRRRVARPDGSTTAAIRGCILCYFRAIVHGLETQAVDEAAPSVRPAPLHVLFVALDRAFGVRSPGDAPTDPAQPTSRPPAPCQIGDIDDRSGRFRFAAGPAAVQAERERERERPEPRAVARPQR